MDECNEVLAAQAHVWNHIFSFIKSMSLKCAVELGIPDIIHEHGRPMTLPELTRALRLPTNHEKSEHLSRLMRILTHSGFFLIVDGEEGRERGYVLTPSSRLLLKDNQLCVTPLMLCVHDPFWIGPWLGLSQWFKCSDPAMTTAYKMFHGKDLWEVTRDEPRVNRLFNDAMSCDTGVIGPVVIRDCGGVFSELGSVVDVGGGTGSFAQAIAEAFPHLRCTVLDLPHVVHGLKGTTHNLAYVGGDMFEFIPPADAVLLKWILHDWSDKECVEILKKCKEAVPRKEEGGMVIIIEIVIVKPRKEEDGNISDEALETQMLFDLEMMVTVTGKERTENEWANLFSEAGFSDYTITPVLGLRSVIQLYYTHP